MNFEQHAERMISISKEKPLLPETFIPWHEEPGEETIFMPEKMVSLEGDELWQSLSAKQQVELGRLEMVQVMYSYAWSETLACLFFNQHLLTLDPQSVEYRFLIRELIEEFRHQEMFGMAIRKLERVPVLPTRAHKFFALMVGRLPMSMTFMSVIAVELMADIYAKQIRRDPRVFSVLRKTAELHHIEEGRHIFYTELWLKRFTEKAGFIRRTIFSLIVMTNIWFMRSLYVQKEFFARLGVSDASRYHRCAVKNYKRKFSEFALGDAVAFVQSFNGFNFITKPLWKRVLSAKL